MVMAEVLHVGEASDFLPLESPLADIMVTLIANGTLGCRISLENSVLAGFLHLSK
jgi:hypothetical protein